MQASGPAGKPLYGVPFVVKDNIDVAGLPTTAACPAFAYHPEKSAFVVERLERRAQSSSARPISTSSRPASSASVRPMGFHAMRCARISYPEGRVPARRRRSARASSRSRLAPTRRDRAACPPALNGIVGLKPSLGALSTSGVVPACRTLDTISIFARDVADAFDGLSGGLRVRRTRTLTAARFRPFPFGFPSGFRLGVPRPDQRQFFDDANSSSGFFARSSARRIAWRAIVEFDFEPFAEVAGRSMKVHGSPSDTPR